MVSIVLLSALLSPEHMHFQLSYHSNMLDMTAHNLSRVAACTHVWTNMLDEAMTQAKLVLESHRNPDIQHVLGSESRMLFINVWISYGIDTLHACLFVVVSTSTHSYLLTNNDCKPSNCLSLGNFSMGYNRGVSQSHRGMYPPKPHQTG